MLCACYYGNGAACRALQCSMLHIAHPHVCLCPPRFTGAPGLGEVTSGYDSNDVLNMKVTLTYPTGFDATSKRLIHGLC